MAAPLLTRRQLGKRLRRLRERADMSTYDVERSGRIKSRRTLARIENGEATSMPFTVIGGLARLYGADTAVTSELERMYRQADDPGMWEEYGQGVREGFALFAEMEQTADRLLIFDPELVTGLLQTDDYATALYRRHPLSDKGSLEQARRFKQRRQRDYWERVGKVDGPSTTIILDEAAIRRPVGGPEVLYGQLLQLRDAAVLPRVTLLVVPMLLADHPAPEATACTILEFNDPLDPDVVYLESLDGCRYIEKPSAVAAYRDVLNVIRDHAIPIEEFLT
ncbi:helix-turn-helix transcriptional regulator [Phytomonospora sp. NPDC050363]|uniref:helix-turn-helix domain-containing protein n=1 Tax=Phytomonospora sp. NPDC050363 TaxID=3155642 RepID=UPI0033C29D1E